MNKRLIRVTVIHQDKAWILKYLLAKSKDLQLTEWKSVIAIDIMHKGPFLLWSEY